MQHQLRGRTALQDYRGLFARSPLPALALTLAMLSFVGIPPLAGFAGKLLLFGATIDGGYAWLAALAVANSVVSLFYYLRVIAPMSFAGAEPPAKAPTLGGWSATGAALAGVLVLALGIGLQGLLGPLGDAVLLP
ncbi:MAG: proton-conducting transporter membrane subunit [Microthrixaceae bacterium]